MLMAVLLQIVSVLAAASVALLVSGPPNAGFLVLGGAAAIIPNGLFAVRLALQRGRSAASYPVVFLLGEMLKIGLTIGLLVVIHRLLAPVAWLPLLIGLIIALKAPLFALARPQGVSAATR